MNPNETYRKWQDEYDRNVAILKLPESYGKEAREKALEKVRAYARLLDLTSPPDYNSGLFSQWINTQ